MCLPQLPPYIELRSPSPEPIPLLPINSINPGPDLQFSPQRTNEVFASIRPKSPHTICDGPSDQIVSQNTVLAPSMVYNATLATIPCLEILDKFRRLGWNRYGSHNLSVTFDLSSFGRVRAQSEDSLETFVDRLSNLCYPGHHMSYLEILFLLVRHGHASTSHLLETIVRRGNERVVELLKKFALEFDIVEYGTRALGTAASLNNFEAVDMLLDAHVDINASIVRPHFTAHCCCQAGIIAYAQLPHFDGDQSGASNEMIAHMLSRGAVKLAEANTWLLGLLNCVLKERLMDENILLSKVQAVVERIDGFSSAVCVTASALETCLVNWPLVNNGGRSRRQVFEYLLAQGAKASPGSPLAALIYKSLLQEPLLWDVLERTEDINAYSNSLPRISQFETVSSKFRPFNGKSINPLQAAALKGNETMVHILLQKGADVNCPARSFCGVTPLQGICRLEVKSPRVRRKKMRMVELLLDSGANVNAAPAWNQGLSALQTAAYVGDVEVADLLVSRGADVNAPPCKLGGGTALAIAAGRSHSDMVQFLLRKGALIPADDDMEILNLFGISAPELFVMYGGGDPSRNYYEYEAEWATDPTYDKKG